MLLSIVSTETSAVTFLSVPGMAFAAGGDLRFLQITFGYIVGRLLIVVLLLPLYFRGEPFTAYEVLERRFGKTSRRASSLLFIVTRNLADALRLYLAALVLQQAMGLEMRDVHRDRRRRDDHLHLPGRREERRVERLRAVHDLHPRRRR